MGILPLVFANPADYERIRQGDVLRIVGVKDALRQGGAITVIDVTQGFEIQATSPVSDRQVGIMLAGGLLNQIKAGAH